MDRVCSTEVGSLACHHVWEESSKNDSNKDYI